MGVGRSTTWPLLVFFAASGGFAADVQTFVISQAHPQLPIMTAYLDIVDAAEQPVSDLTPANFSAVLGGRKTQVTEIKPFQSAGEGVAYVFLVDISKSISPAQLGEMRAAIQTWISGLKPADRAAIGTFGEDYRLITDFTTDKQKLAAALDGLAPQDLHTRLYLALNRAVELDQRVDAGLPVRRVIVVLSDGKDEGSAITLEDLLLKVRASRLPVYSIGLSHLRPAEKQRYLDVLHRFSNASGGLYEEPGAESVSQLYVAIQQAILRVFVVRLACSGCPADGRSYPLEITLSQGTRVLKAIPLDLVLLPGPSTPPPVKLPWFSGIPFWGWLVAAVAVLAVLTAGRFAVLRRKQPSPSPPMPDNISDGPPGASEAAPRGTSTAEPESEKGMALRLTVVVGKDAGSSYELKLHNKVVIGRAPDCDLTVSDPQVSSHHCELALIQGQLVVYDLGSTNSTCVNGVPIVGRHKLESRDTILVGDTELRVHFEET
jgi:VWFA-related protein